MSAKPPIVVLEQATLDGDGRLRVSGWAAGGAPVERVEIEIGGHVLGRAELGRPRPDVAADHPSLVGAAASGFVFSLTLETRPGEGETVVAFGRDENGRVASAARTLSAVAPPRAAGLRLVLDTPRLVEGALAQPVRRMLAVEGWAAARNGPVALDAFLDGSAVGGIKRGLRRRDIAAAFPGWPGALHSGFTLILPRRAFSGARQTLRLVARDAAGATQELSLAVELAPDPEDDASLALRRFAPQAETDVCEALIERHGARPVFAVEVIEGEGLEATLASLRAQTYRNFTVEAAPPSPSPRLEPSLSERVVPAKAGTQGPDDVRLTRSSGEGGAALSAERRFFLRLRAGDRLAVDALMQFALEIAARPEVDFLYADDRRPAPFLKPGWSPELLLSTNYIGRAFAAAADLRPGLPEGDYDAVLRLTEAARAVAHIPRVLFETPPRADGEAAALEAARVRRGLEGAFEPTAAPGVFRLRRPAPQAIVSIVIPTVGAGGHIEACLASIRRHTRPGTYEIVCIDNRAEPSPRWRDWLKRHAERVVEHREAFNWSRLNNLGAAAARGDYLLFLNDDTEAVEPGWLEALLEQARRPEIGAVGPRLLYPDGRVQQAGMYLADGQARHAFAQNAADDPGPFGLACAVREVACLTGAAMLMRRDVFERMGGFDEAHAVVNNDIDMGLRLRHAGLTVLYTPHATLIHREMASRGAIEDAYDAAAFAARWGRDFARGDPYWPPGLSREDPGYAPDPEPARLIVAGGPLIAAGSVARLLVVKLDHVGDFVTALPAIRRLRAAFPKAEITLLAAPASAALARAEPSIDRILPFAFFAAVSQDGRREIGAEEWRALEARLQGFDIAIDLRKQTETREVLARAGARLKAGFDCRGAFPWLDVALEWEGDAPYREKRAPVSDDALGLAEAVIRACARPPAPPPPAPRPPPALAGRPYVVIHPGAGSALRQWPHFSALIDLLLDAYDVEIVLIGAESEAGLAGPLSRERLWPLFGRTPVEDLPGLLSAARLFVGNNSGPHHIAAAAGTPTVGVHSGVASAREWGPVGPLAVAVQRRMSCAPCYLDRPERCPRGLACLAGLSPGEVFRICERMLGPEWRRRP